MAEVHPHPGAVCPTAIMSQSWQEIPVAPWQAMRPHESSCLDSVAWMTSTVPWPAGPRGSHCSQSTTLTWMPIHPALRLAPAPWGGRPVPLYHPGPSELYSCSSRPARCICRKEALGCHSHMTQEQVSMKCQPPTGHGITVLDPSEQERTPRPLVPAPPSSPQDHTQSQTGH